MGITLTLSHTVLMSKLNGMHNLLDLKESKSLKSLQMQFRMVQEIWQRKHNPRTFSITTGKTA